MSVEEEQAYDLLSQVNKHIMLRNGAFDFENIPNTKCLCGHSIYEHLIDHNGDADCCLYAKGEVCICDKFADQGAKMVVPPKGKLPKKQEVQVLEDPRLNNYVQTLSQM